MRIGVGTLGDESMLSLPMDRYISVVISFHINLINVGMIVT